MNRLEDHVKNDIELLMRKSNDEYKKGNYMGSIKCLEEAWDILPDSHRGIYSESFHVVRAISEAYLSLNDFSKSKEWCDKIFQCGLQRIDSGERELLSGKNFFELGELDKAKAFFSIAYEKSSGRCFIGEKEKYIKFFKTNNVSS